MRGLSTGLAAVVHKRGGHSQYGLVPGACLRQTGKGHYREFNRQGTRKLAYNLKTDIVTRTFVGLADISQACDDGHSITVLTTDVYDSDLCDLSDLSEDHRMICFTTLRRRFGFRTFFAFFSFSFFFLIFASNSKATFWRTNYCYNGSSRGSRGLQYLQFSVNSPSGLHRS
jgi:hypothetical protein